MLQIKSWDDLSGLKVGLWGFGVEGKATLKILEDMGITPVIVDESFAISQEDQTLSFKSGGSEKLKGCDVVIKSPGISPYLEEAQTLVDVPVIGSIDIWMNSIDRSKVICITGTKGKSTTSALSAKILESLGYKVFLGGNIGSTPFETKPGDYDYWVIETSSFQVSDLSVGPKIVGLTSLHPDHLDWHISEEQYYSDKLSIVNLPGVEEVFVNSDNERLMARKELKSLPNVHMVSSKSIDFIDKSETKLRGDHNRSNMALAVACVQGLLGEDDLLGNKAVVATLKSFEGLEHRFQTVGTLGEIEFINDSLSTNVLPTVAALDALEGENVAIIIGGYDRGVDQSDLVDYLAAKGSNTFVAAIPDTGLKILEGLNVSETDVNFSEFSDLDAAVEGSYRWLVEQGGQGFVLLSPAAASFNAFENYKVRGEAFSNYVKRLIEQN